MTEEAERLSKKMRRRSNAGGDRARAPRCEDKRIAEVLDGIDWPEITDEAIERSMRVYTADEAMDLLDCGAPGASASTEEWLQFLARMKVAPPTRATQRGIKEGERQLGHRWFAGASRDVH
jgi:hypothetical protein